MAIGMWLVLSKSVSSVPRPLLVVRRIEFSLVVISSVSHSVSGELEPASWPQ